MNPPSWVRELSRFDSIHVLKTYGAVTRQQFRFPRSRKLRIRKKWQNREENFRHVPAFYVTGNAVYCHPSLYERIRKEIECHL
jgi:hypothetical protein